MTEEQRAGLIDALARLLTATSRELDALGEFRAAAQIDYGILLLQDGASGSAVGETLVGTGHREERPRCVLRSADPEAGLIDTSCVTAAEAMLLLERAIAALDLLRLHHSAAYPDMALYTLRAFVDVACASLHEQTRPDPTASPGPGDVRAPGDRA